MKDLILKKEHLEILNVLDGEERVTALCAVCEYVLYKKKPSEDTTPARVAKLICKKLDLSHKRAEAGRKGGSKNASKTQANVKQTIKQNESKLSSKNEANVKQNTKQNESKLSSKNEANVKQSIKQNASKSVSKIPSKMQPNETPEKPAPTLANYESETPENASKNEQFFEAKSPTNCEAKNENFEIYENQRKEKEAKRKEGDYINSLVLEKKEEFKKEKNIKKEKNEKTHDLDFVAPDFKPIFTEWLSYKKERRETYKTTRSMMACYKNLIKLSDNDPLVAEQIIEQSIANNWAGLFALNNKNQNKNREYGSTKIEPSKSYDERVFELGNAQCPAPPTENGM